MAPDWNPLLLELAKGLPTASISLLVGFLGWVVANRQSKTAHQKFVMEMFDRRIAVYDLAAEAMTEYRRGRPEEIRKSQQLLLQAINQSRFLFGLEVTDHLTEMLAAVGSVERAQSLAQSSPAIAEPAIEIANRSIDALSCAMPKLVNLCAPYIGMHEKLR